MADAEKADKATRNKDWSLHAIICRRYPFGSEERAMFDNARLAITLEMREATKPDYFN